MPAWSVMASELPDIVHRAKVCGGQCCDHTAQLPFALSKKGGVLIVIGVDDEWPGRWDKQEIDPLAQCGPKQLARLRGSLRFDDPVDAGPLLRERMLGEEPGELVPGLEYDLVDDDLCGLGSRSADMITSVKRSRSCSGV
jgi:hypothetical protein